MIFFSYSGDSQLHNQIRTKCVIHLAFKSALFCCNHNTQYVPPRVCPSVQNSLGCTFHIVSLRGSLVCASANLEGKESPTKHSCVCVAKEI